MTSIIETKTFETLYGKSKNGKIKNWSIWVENFDDYSDIVTLHGQLGGAYIENRRRISKGKNIGKINETSHFQQAIQEALSKWTKKKDIEQYTINKTEAMDDGLEGGEVSVNTEVNENSENNTIKLPMLAQDYSKHKKKLKFPCFIQPKLDGYRMIFNTNNKSITTRQGKEFTVVKESGKLYNELCELSPGYILDGELYVHGSLVSFEALGVLRKTKKLSEDDNSNLYKIEYHVYDLIDTMKSFENRLETLKSIISENKYKMIKLVDTFKIQTENEIQKFHEKFTSDHYEGSMLRNANALYLEKNRSHDLLKYKDFMDDEFEIVDYSFEKDTSGEDRNCIVWVVKVKEGVLCNVRPKGPKEQRQELFQECVNDFTKFKGRKLWTKFFDYTGDGSLRFPSTKTEDVKSYIRDEVL